MSNAKREYRDMYRLARKVKTFTGKESEVKRAFDTYSQRVIWLAFWSLAQRKAFPNRYHWQNARRGEIFRSSRTLRNWDIPF